jgi:outer membrane protein assembly factor BamD (BamD/ComL family)
MAKRLFRVSLLASMAFMASLGLVTCASAPVIPANATASELLQLGQNELDGHHYSNAIIYFQTVIDKYATNTDAVCNAQYEIGHTHYKQGRYIMARQEFQALFDRYNQTGGDLLPPQFKILAQIGLNNVAKKTHIPVPKADTSAST